MPTHHEASATPMAAWIRVLRSATVVECKSVALHLYSKYSQNGRILSYGDDDDPSSAQTGSLSIRSKFDWIKI